MRRKKPSDPLSMFVAEKLRDLFNDGRGESLKSMSERTGYVPKSGIGLSTTALHNVKEELNGVGFKAAEYAKVLRYDDVDDMQREAISWYTRRVQKARKSPPSPAPLSPGSPRARARTT